ncbi:hypothetical protein SAMN04487897_12158 [Paenibacillus sp. yr247]|uniref:hypothetical protein n=1 Tax=Paenibacillus sp. yr247 TaxID=1761880 RepID=UPI000884AC16|nr:hypothetical protein [Paenibacillus sp. yr247]SDO75979.1 hypothetical protein SAMN04487897_12158 [Paenibacillus sp. yr247]
MSGLEKKEDVNIDIVNILTINDGIVKEVSKIGRGNHEKTEVKEGGAKRIEEQDDIKEIYGLGDNDEYAG